MLPFFTIFGVEIRSYPFMYALGAVASCAVCVLLAKKKALSIAHTVLLALCAIASGIIGAAAAYCLVTYGISGTLALIKSGNFETGLVFYGGAIGGAFFTWLIARLLRLDISAYTGVLVSSVPLGHAIGRIGCYMAGCCGGITLNGFQIPVQLIESACLFVIFTILIHRCLKGKTVLIPYIFMYASIRFILEFLRGDEIRGFYAGLSTSQWISIALAAITAVISLRGRHIN